MIKNIAFDFGGVFCKINLQGCVARFKALGFADIDQFLNEYAQKGIFGQLEAGEISDEQFRREVAVHVGHDVSWSECQHAWLGFMGGVMTDNLQALLSLRSRGYRLALLSNTNPFVTSWFRSPELDGKGNGIGHYIAQEHQYLSFEQKTMKPGKDIFLNMLRNEGFVPEETLFVDDGLVNIKTAQSLGLQTFQPENGEHWAAKLDALLGA